MKHEAILCESKLELIAILDSQIVQFNEDANISQLSAALKRLLSGSGKIYITYVAPLTWNLLEQELVKVF